jgi:hypothetical protein
MDKTQKNIELDTKILNKNLEITRLTKQIDDLTSDNVDLKEKLKFNDLNLSELLNEVHERMYKMMVYLELLQPVKIKGNTTIDLTEDDEDGMFYKTKLFRILSPNLEKDKIFEDQTSSSILKDLRKVIKSLEK